MARIRYTGASTLRTISKEDFVNIGVTDQEYIQIDTRVSRETDMSDSASEWLVKNEGSDWMEVQSEQGEPKEKK
jgi:hypothetical protein